MRDRGGRGEGGDGFSNDAGHGNLYILIRKTINNLAMAQQKPKLLFAFPFSFPFLFPGNCLHSNANVETICQTIH
jgi:hypothetical protein